MTPPKLNVTPAGDVCANGVTHATFLDSQGTQRFRCNRVVRYLIDRAGAGQHCDMNDLVSWAHTNSAEEDLREFYRLIGYSVSGYGDAFPDDTIEDV